VHSTIIDQSICNKAPHFHFNNQLKKINNKKINKKTPHLQPKTTTYPSTHCLGSKQTSTSPAGVKRIKMQKWYHGWFLSVQCSTKNSYIEREIMNLPFAISELQK